VERFLENKQKRMVEKIDSNTPQNTALARGIPLVFVSDGAARSSSIPLLFREEETSGRLPRVDSGRGCPK
jgi:hypothetical protein